jgi:hypothetical protein
MKRPNKIVWLLLALSLNLLAYTNCTKSGFTTAPTGGSSSVPNTTTGDGSPAKSNSGVSPSTTPTPAPVPGVVPTPAPVSSLVPTTGSAAGNSTNGAGGISVTCLAVPASPAASAHSYYVDPVNGSDKNDGSAAAPWQNLSNVLATKVSNSIYGTPYLDSANKPLANGIVAQSPTGPVHGGDIIYLRTGNHGAVSVKGLNSDFVFVQAAPGQSPVLQSLTVQGASKWIFKNLKIQSQTAAAQYGSLVTISLHGWIGAVDNIVFSGNTVSSIDDSSSWAIADWLAHAQGHALSMDGGTDGNYGNCLTITGNSFSNIRSGVALATNHTTFDSNTIDYFGDDALDYCANDLVITHNRITNNLDLGDANHNDGMQGQIGRGTSYKNILIDGNTVIRQTDPTLKFPGSLQGIDAFDNDWTNITVSNNVVIVNAYHGISYSSVHGATIVNNSVFNDGGGAQETWINVGSQTHEGTPSNNVILRNNVTQSLVTNLGPEVLTMDHNMASARVDLLVNGVTQYNSKAGVYGDKNTLNPNLMTQFVNFNTTTMTYDLHPIPGASIKGTGFSPMTPSQDLEGAARAQPPTLGAYN